MPVQFLINLLQRNVQIKIDLPSKLKSPETWAFLEIHKKRASEADRWFYHHFVYFKNVNTSDDCITDWILYLLRCLYTLFHVILVTCRLVHETLLRWTNEKKQSGKTSDTIFLKIAGNNWMKIHVSLWTNYLLSLHQNWQKTHFLFGAYVEKKINCVIPF